jgi:hypothetical protein
MQTAATRASTPAADKAALQVAIKLFTDLFDRCGFAPATPCVTRATHLSLRALSPQARAQRGPPCQDQGGPACSLKRLPPPAFLHAAAPLACSCPSCMQLPLLRAAAPCMLPPPGPVHVGPRAWPARQGAGL